MRKKSPRGDDRQKIRNRTTDTQSDLARCHQRWCYLFFGMWNALGKHDPNLIQGLVLELERVGLAHGDSFASELFEINPSDDVLSRAARFHQTGKIPSLRGKTRQRLSPFLCLQNYSVVLHILRDLPRRVRNPAHRVLLVKERLSKILHWIGASPSRVPTDRQLRDWATLPVRSLTLRLTAHTCGREPNTFRRELSRAKRLYPELARLWKHGCEVIEG